jgi:ribosomal silencing factor RsfS
MESEYVGYHQAGGIARNPFKAQRLLYSRREEASRSWILLQLMNVIEHFITRRQRRNQKVAILVRGFNFS